MAFAATVVGTTVEVTWSVQEANGGTIDQGGLYTAPSAAGTFHVVATTAGSPAVSGSATVNVTTATTTPLLPAARRTTWRPGIPGGVPDSTGFTVHSTVALGGNASANRSAIQSAVDAAGAVATAQSPRVVLLPAGTYHLDGTVYLDQSYVVLRGAGPDVKGTGSGTRLVMDAANSSMFFMGNYTAWGAPKDLTADAAKGASSFTLAAGHGVQVGDLLQIDRVDTSDVSLEGGTWWKRGPGNSDNGPISPAGYRSIGQVVEVTSVSGNVVTIAGVLHQSYPVATYASQVFGSTDRRAGWAGIGLENMTITGWTDAFGVQGNWMKRSWVKRVEFDGLPSAQGGVGTGSQGCDLRVFRSVRFTLQGSYLHQSRAYLTDNHAYGVSLAEQTSDSLIQDNIVWFKNKNIVLEASGGGNVIAYNYVEDPVIDSGSGVRTDWMEMGIDGSHLSAPSFDLIEGNFTAKMGAAETHGNAGDQTFYRNYSRGDRLYSLSGSSPSIAAVMFNRYMRRMNVVGNVLGTKAGGIYEPTWSGDNVPSGEISAPKIWSIGLDGWNGNWGGPRDPSVEQQLSRFANYDTLRNRVDTQPTDALPDSLYLTGKPAFFGDLAWPWVDPLGSASGDRLKSLPAQARFVAGTFL